MSGRELLTPHSAHPQTGSARQAIARGIVALTKEYVGRGPTTARAYIEEDLVTVLLHETLTPVEKTLTHAGSGDVVSAMRDDFSDAMCADAVALIESVTGQKVEAFMTGHSIDADYSVLTFVLTATKTTQDDPCDDPGLGADATGVGLRAN